jgi:hypothetical protein
MGEGGGGIEVVIAWRMQELDEWILRSRWRNIRSGGKGGCTAESGLQPQKTDEADMTERA